MSSSLSDADLATQLRAMGADIGPVNGATRRVYQRKLKRLSLGGLPQSESNLNATGDSLSNPVDDESTSLPLSKDTVAGDFLKRPASDNFSSQPVPNADAKPPAPNNLNHPKSCDDVVDRHSFTSPDSQTCGASLPKPLKSVPSENDDDDDDDENEVEEVVGQKFDNSYNSSVYDSYMYDDETKENYSAIHDETKEEFNIPLHQRLLEGQFNSDLDAVFRRRKIVAEADSCSTAYVRPNNSLSYAPSPRSPLSTYRSSNLAPKSPAVEHLEKKAESISKDELVKIKPAGCSSEANKSSYFKIAALVISVFILFLIIFFSMEPGYQGPQ